MKTFYNVMRRIQGFRGDGLTDESQRLQKDLKDKLDQIQQNEDILQCNEANTGVQG